MAGQLVYLVGASGSGKDSILRQLALDLPTDCVIMQRAITRPASETEAAESLTVDEFEYAAKKGEFSLRWQANGLLYGIRTALNDHLALGKTVLVNGSRAYWPQVVAQYPNTILAVVQVEQHLLRERLQLRGRESEPAIQQRLDRNIYLEQTLASQAQSQQTSLWWLDNSGELQVAVDTLRQQLTQLNANV